MKSLQNIKRRFALTPALAFILLVCFADRSFGSWDYGNGRHGYFVLTTNATIEQLYQAVRLTNDPAQYNPADSNAIPNFQRLTITNGATLTANAWDGNTGGRIVLKVEDKLIIASGSSISANGIGFRGGGYLSHGESFLETSWGSYLANFGGGGGGYGMPNGYFTSAGGGGYATGGGTGGGNPYATYNGIDYRGVGGSSYGDGMLSTIYLGSGGGGGAVFAPAPYIYPFIGGAGGGAVILNVGNLVISGQIQANGGIPHYEVSGTASVVSSGGGGSGGSIVLRLKTASLGTNLVTANGGSGYNNGGSGGVGRIAVSYFSNYSGVTTPSAYTLADTNSDNVTIITGQPASQTNFWSSNAVVTVGISGYPPFNFQWYFNGGPIFGATNQSLTLTSLDFTNQGNYFVVVSNAVMSVTSSNAFLTVLDGRDFDDDGIPNYWEQQYGLDPNNPADAILHPVVGGQTNKLTYLQIHSYGLNPLTLDTDGDGLSDYDELFVYGTDPLKTNTSGDGIPDGWKVQYGLNPRVANANDEISSSGVTYWQVYQYNLGHTNQLNPRDPFFAPGTSIYEVLNGGQHTNRIYYDRNDRLIGEEFSRSLAVAYQYDGNDNLVRQTHLSRASETNGLPALWRFLNGITNDNPYADSDGDGWTDYQEWRAGTNPRDQQSTPNLLTNPGTEIASLALPFSPSNFVVGAGQLDGFGTEEIVISADGNPGTNVNFLLVLTQAAVGWSTQRVDVGSFGVTSIAVGQPAGRTNAAIYVGLHGTNGIGQVEEFSQSSGVWQSNIVAVSTNDAAYVLGVRPGADLVASFSTNGVDAGLFSLSVSNNVWNRTILSMNRGDKTLGSHGTVWSRIFRDASVRLVNTNQIELIVGDREAVKNNLLLPTNWVFNPTYGKYYFQTTNAVTWDDGEAFAQQYGAHLVTIGDTVENYWIASQFAKPYWIGLYFVHYGGSQGNFYGAWISSGQSPNLNYAGSYFNPLWAASPFYNFEVPPPYVYPATDGVAVGLNGNELWNVKYHTNPYRSVADATGVQTYSNRWLLSSSTFPNRIRWKENQIALGRSRAADMNGSALVTGFVSDSDSSGNVSPADDFVFAEYRVSGDTVTLLTQTNIPVGSNGLAQSFAVIAADFLNSGSDTIFTAEPNGRIFSWSGTDTNSALKRQLFSGAYAGKAWQALASVRMAVGGQGLAGLMADPTNQNICHVIFWSSQVALPAPPPEIVETAPVTAVLPSSVPLGSTAHVGVRLWDAEGNPSKAFLQYQFSGATNWQDATVTALDGSSYDFATWLATHPNGVNHTLTWDALSDVGGNVVTNVLLRARGQDFMLLGDWSIPTTFELDTTLITPPTNSPVTFTGTSFVPGGISFNWEGGSNTWLYLQRSPALVGTNAIWINIWTGAPPMPYIGGYTDLIGTNSMEFYRLKIGSP